MYNSSDAANRIKSLCKSKHIPVKLLLEEVGLGFNTMSNMKTSMPKADNLAKIADYLGCSVDYLLGRTESPTLDNTQTTGSSINEMEAQVILEYRKSDDMTKEMVHCVLHISVKRENQNLAL